MNHDDFTNAEFMFPTTHGHRLRVIDWGNKKAKVPFIFLHGGPGNGVSDKHKKAFDPLKHRVIFFDQRGAGESKPQGSLKHNTTQDLIEDISRIANELRIKKFYLHGSSWGSALALAYSLEHPEKVAGIIIGGVYTASRFENDWVDQGHLKTFYPDAWQEYLDNTPKEFRENPTAYHYDKALHGSKRERKLSAFVYDTYGSKIARLDDRYNSMDFKKYDPIEGMIICIHYLANDCFLPERHILNNASKLNMPVWIVQGRYDMVCPPATAYELHQKLSNSKLYWAQSNHGAEHENENIFRAIFAEL